MMKKFLFFLLLSVSWIVAKPACSVNAGPDKTVSCLTAFPGGSVTLAGTGTGTITAMAGNPGTATITTPGSPTTTITNFSVAGTYHFILTGSGCADTVAVVVSGKPNAGNDQYVQCLSLDIAVLTTPDSGGVWTALSTNPGTATIGTSIAGRTDVYHYSAVGTYQYVLTVNGCTDTAAIVVNNQCSSPDVVAGLDQSLNCSTSCTNLTATYFNTGASTSYRVDSIAYNPYPFRAGTIYLNGMDDEYGGLIPLPFKFCFFDTAYSNIVIGANADVTFNASSANGYDNFQLTTGFGTGPAVPGLPNRNLTRNSIMGPLQDIDPAIRGNIYYQSYGTAPSRIFVISYTRIPMFQCTTLIDTNQIVLYETTNAIEITCTHKPDCTGWNGGLAIEGIQSASGTRAYVVPGRNNTQWTANHDSWRFTPNGPSIVTVNWSNAIGGATLGTVIGDSTQKYTISVCPPTDPLVPVTTSYVATATYRACDGDTIIRVQTVDVTTNPKPNAGPDQNLGCYAPGLIATMAASLSIGSSWTAVSTNPSATLILLPNSPVTTISGFTAAGTYKYVWGTAACNDTVAIVITSHSNAGPDQTVTGCIALPGGSVTMAATGVGTWTAQSNNPGTAVITTPGDSITTITTFSATGVYHFIYANGTCADTAAVTVTGKPNAGTDQSISCFNAASFVTMTATGTGTWTAATGNPGTATITTPSSPTTTITNFSAAGVYVFVFTSGSCTDSATVTVTAKPNAGADQILTCISLPGGTATMAATGTGTWAPAATGNPGTATITTPTSPTTTITGFTAAGTYSFVYTSGSCSDTATVTVTAKPNAGADQSVSCYPANNSATLTATGTGSWSAASTNTGTATITTPGSATTTVTGFSAAGVYNFVYTSGGCTDTVSVTVTTKPNAGADQTLSCVSLPGGTATMTATGTGTWAPAATGNPGTATITTPTSPTTTITGFTAAGTYSFVYTSGSCSDTAIVTVTAKPNAGADQSVSCYPSNNSATLTATGTGSWSAASTNTGTATITTPGSASTTVTGFSAAGVYNFVYTSGGCTDTATVTVTTKPDAGPDQTVSCVTLPGGTATMAATGTGTWTPVATGNPGTATITTPTSPTTTITGFTAAGVYSFVWTSGSCSDTATVTISTKANAGSDQTVSCVSLPGGTATLTATGTGTWTADPANTGTATITTPGSASTTVTGFSAAGIYNFIWTSGGCADTATITVTPKPNAGADQTLTCVSLPGGSVTMAATGIGFWSAQSGNPGSATITSQFSATTTITGFTAAGTYNFIWSIGICTDTVAVTVTAKPSAGADQFVTCFPTNSTATLAATGIGTWTADPSNTGTAFITNAADPGTTVTTFSAIGTYNFIWTSGGCADTATVTVTGNANAGPDQTVSCATLPGGSATMAASGTGTWTAQTGNPGNATITTSGSPTTTITDFTAAGAYNFIWTSGGCADTATVTVTAKPNAGSDQSVSCVASFPGGSVALAATGTGTWTADPGNTGTAFITDPSNPATTVTSFSGTGSYSFIWTNGSCADTAVVTVTGKPDAGADQTVSCFTSSSSATLAATGTGIWTAQSNNPGTATITTPTDPSTTITNFSSAGTYNFIWTSGGCTDTAAIIVSAKPNAGPDQTVSCVVLPGGLAALAAAGTGIWTADGGNTGTATITDPSSPTTTITGFSAAGSYNFIYTSGGCADTATITVTAKPDAGADATICANGSATLDATGTGTWSAQANNPATTVIATPASSSTGITGFSVAGTYNFIWTVSGCTDTATVHVNAAPTLSPTATNITCTNAIGVIAANASGAQPFSYVWSGSSTTDTIHTTTGGTLYTVTVTDNNLCTASASDSVSNLIVTVSIADSLTNISCAGSSDGKIVLNVSPAGTYTYSWDNHATTDSITGLAPGTYSVTVSDANGCSATAGPFTLADPASDQVVVAPLDSVVTLGDTIQLTTVLTGPFTSVTYAWTPTTGLSCSDCPNPVLTPTVQDTTKTAYQVTITYNNGCTATAIDSIQAKSDDLSAIPNAFTPNGDTKNDEFKILATGVKDFRMAIYDRWGQQLFETTDITQGWDGNYKGKPEPEEVYTFFYNITYLNGKVEARTGTFALQR